VEEEMAVAALDKEATGFEADGTGGRFILRGDT